ncbi:FBP domain-containing protein [Homoserinibacter sp. YIM 151385]|uniref:FBP domain-containing protein n=1 Tax=Homoserinibacter sp. YIM 151385 TaxID=2985506 RepID=UPI0022F13167|nr:FBP domain-containing protein [Homoserinibacter sp. YIM 151385]WBU38051.1 FBP domain-containing protein [Homoserinibacter sp. YIM 151385]
MISFTDAQLRASFVNTSLKERKAIRLPEPGETRWDRLDYLGWRDPKRPELGFVVVELDGAALGIQLRQAEAAPIARAQCSWCEDVQLPNDVVFFGARLAGAAGRKGDTIGTLICAGFECSANVRRLPPLAYEGFDREAARDRRIEALGEHARRFARNVLRGEAR